jgi:hypothetical protein
MKTFSATMEQIRWCRVEDVLQWYLGDFAKSIAVSVLSESEMALSKGETRFNKSFDLFSKEIPCDQFTASVIMRASENLRGNTWTNCFCRQATEENCFLSFWDFAIYESHCGNCAIPSNPDSTGEYNKWTREWVETVLKGMG